MSIQRNLNDGNIKDILRRLYRLERQSMLAHSAIGREGLEVYDGGWIRILNGGLEVIGTATISGTLDVTGIFNASGVNNLSGENHLTGPTDVAGNFEIIAGGLFKSGTVEIRPDGSADFGTLNIESDGTLNVNNDVNVMENGIINVGTNMKLTPSDDGGAMVFQDGSKVSSVGGTVQVKSSSPGVGFTAGLNTAGIGAGPNGAIMSVGDDGEWVIQGGQATIQSLGNRISATGELSVSDQISIGNMTTAPGSAVANVYWDTSSKRLMVVI
ncbi:hypothetical protein ACT17S_00590 [Glutamicibacter mysorens]